MSDTNKIDVRYVANLARMELTEEEISKFQDQLEQIVGYVEKIGALDLKNVEPTSHPRPMQNVFRDDVVNKGLDTEQAMQNAPERSGNFFRVPRMVE